MCVQEMEEYFAEVRSMLSNRELISRYKTLKFQCENDLRSDKMLINYINELECRGLKY